MHGEKKIRKYIERDEPRKLTKWLAKHGDDADLDTALTRDGKSGLHLAAKLGHEDCMLSLLKAGARVTVKDSKVLNFCFIFDIQSICSNCWWKRCCCLVCF